MELSIAKLSETIVSPIVPVVLLLILAGSSTIFVLVLRRWTIHRPQRAMLEWAEDHNFEIQSPECAELPQAFATVSSPPPKVVTYLIGKDISIAQIETLTSENGTPHRWNLLIRKLETARSFAALRPSMSRHSALDLFDLSEMRTIAQGDRFILYGTDAKLMRAISHSSMAALLPANIGLALIRESLILDFSARPFDLIELQRMLVVADQLLSHLPAAY